MPLDDLALRTFRWIGGLVAESIILAIAFTYNPLLLEAITEPSTTPRALLGYTIIAALIGIAMLVGYLYAKRKPPIKSSQLDNSRLHLEVFLFWETIYYAPIIYQLGLKNARRRLPGTAIVVNHKTKKAYLLNEELKTAVQEGRIQYNDERKSFPNSQKAEWAASQGYTFFERKPTSEDLE